MRKLIVNTGTLSAGGAERVLSILSKSFADAFDEVQYLMWLDSKYPDIFYNIDPRVKIVKISESSGSTSIWRHMLWFRNYVKKEKPDVVLSFMVMICFTVTVSLLFTGIKQVVAERNDPRFFGKRWLRHIINLLYLSPSVKGILMQTEWNREYFRNDKLRDKSTVIFNPVSLEKELVGLAFRHTKEDIIVSVGRLTRQKQQWVLIDAFSEFCRTHSSYKLIIYGEGEMRKTLEERIEKLGIGDRVSLPGRSKQVLNDIMSARMFVLTSLYEGMSNALIEALCIGLPCISTKVSGATDLIENGENGFLVDVGDTTAIVERMTFLAENSQKAEEMGKKAVLIYHLLSDDAICNKWVNYLQSKI